jgi:hypothetical protein
MTRWHYAVAGTRVRRWVLFAVLVLSFAFAPIPNWLAIFLSVCTGIFVDPMGGWDRQQKGWDKKTNFIPATDTYKLDHWKQYPPHQHHYTRSWEVTYAPCEDGHHTAFFIFLCDCGHAEAMPYENLTLTTPVFRAELRDFLREHGGTGEVTQ